MICISQLIIASFIYIVHWFARIVSYSYSLSPVRWYLADILFLIVLIPIMANIELLLGCRKRMYVSIIEIVAYGILASVVFELFSPFVLGKGTADIFDVPCYFIGGLILFFTQPKHGRLLI